MDATITVGVIDSAYELPDWITDYNRVNRNVDLLPNCTDDDTTGHGTIVCRILSSFSDRLEFNLYRVTQDVDGGTIWERHLIDAIGHAHVRDSVDLINISAGNDHSEDGNEGCAHHREPCKVRDAAEKAIGDGIPVIAAAGNEDQYDSVCCPSLLDRAVSVGGFVSKCTCRPESGASPASTISKPPLACWTPRDEVEYAFCSGNDCLPLPMCSCEDSRWVANWSGNVDPVWNKPDIMGPAAALLSRDGPEILPATSWATPVVTAMAAEIIAGVRDRGHDTPPYLIRQAFVNTARELDTGEEMLLDAQSSLQYVYDELGLPRPNIGDPSVFELDVWR